MLNCEQWENVLKSVFDGNTYEVAVKINQSERNTFVRKKGTIKPKYIKIYPKQNATHVVLNHAVVEYLKGKMVLRKEDKYKGNEYHYKFVEDSFIKEVCDIFSRVEI